MGKDSLLGVRRTDSFILMTQHPDDPDLGGYVDWIVFDRSWSTFSDDCASLEEAHEVAGRTGGGPIFRREWKREPEGA